MCKYIIGISDNERNILRKDIEEGIKQALDARYNFYQVTVSSPDTFIKDNFYDYEGNMFMVKDSSFICFAFDNVSDIYKLLPLVDSCQQFTLEKGIVTKIK